MGVDARERNGVSLINFDVTGEAGRYRQAIDICLSRNSTLSGDLKDVRTDHRCVIAIVRDGNGRA